MNTAQISLNSLTPISAQCQDLHKAVILFNQTSSSDEEKSVLKAYSEKHITSLDVFWDLIPVS